MKHFRHLRWEDRLVIEKLHATGSTVRAIAAVIGVSPSTISREIRRGLYSHTNTDLTTTLRYSAQIADNNARWLFSSHGPDLALGSRYDYVSRVSGLLRSGFSPASVVFSLRRSGSWSVSVPTLYRYIRSGLISGVSVSDLPDYNCRHRRRPRPVRRRVSAPPGLSIEQRPQHINDRSEFGHWEIDSIVGKSSGTRQSLLVLTERLSRYEIVCRVPDKTSASTVAALRRLVKRFPRGVFKSLTCDNGSEFADGLGMRSAAGCPVYYCHPYCSSERGSNERNNRILRRFWPKGSSLSSVKPADCLRVADLVNSIPRRIFGYRSAAEIFSENLLHFS